MKHLYEYLVGNHTTGITKKIKTDADNIVYVTALGNLSSSGKMNGVDGSIWDKKNSDGAEIFGDGRNFLVGPEGCLKKGDTVTLVDAETERRLPSHLSKIDFISKCSLEDFIDKYIKKCPATYNIVGRIPWKRFSIIHSIDHIEAVDHSNDKPKREVAERPMKTWTIRYVQQTPMGLSGSHEYTTTVKAKTKQGAMGKYNRNIYQGPSSPYATQLISIEETV